jgi:hypothetical protein
MDFLAKGKKSYYTGKSHLKKHKSHFSLLFFWYKVGKSGFWEKSVSWYKATLRLVLYGRKKKSHFAGKMDFLAKGKKSYYTGNCHLKKVKEWFLPQKVTFFPYNMEKKTIFHVKWTKITFLK